MGDGVGTLRRPEKGSLVGRRALAEKGGTGPGLPSLLLWPQVHHCTSPLSASISSSMKWEEEMVSPGNGFLWKYSELSPGKTQVWPQGPFSSEPVCSHVCAWALGSLWVGTDVWACDRERWGLL